MAPSIEEILEDKYNDHVHPWEEIVHYVSINQVSQLRRNREAEIIYRKWTADTLVKYGSIENFLVKEKLHFPDTEPSYLVLPNDFPYSTEPGVEHVLVWSKQSLSAEFIESVLEERYGSSVWEWIYFVNPPEYQSIRCLPHAHVFMRRRQK
ncbi:hypothetical protein RMCBS344292_04133 [Rhizopus microsporus]|nr:hypothetical protein RMCBS344292_04133 [Rhizopus microsporus]